MLARSMKTNHLAFDDVADSMSAAAGRLRVPLEAVKAAKRLGSSAFRGSRVNLTQLREEIASAENEPSLSEILMNILEMAVLVIASKKAPAKDAFNLTSAVQVGFGVAVLVLEPARVDEFLRQSAKLCERIVGGPLRKAATRP
jgi:hypothetical protein